MSSSASDESRCVRRGPGFPAHACAGTAARDPGGAGCRGGRNARLEALEAPSEGFDKVKAGRFRVLGAVRSNTLFALSLLSAAPWCMSSRGPRCSPPTHKGRVRSKEIYGTPREGREAFLRWPSTRMAAAPASTQEAIHSMMEMTALAPCRSLTARINMFPLADSSALIGCSTQWPA